MQKKHLVAPFWHTALLVGLIGAVALTGTLLSLGASPSLASPAPGSRILQVYLPSIAVQCMLVTYVCFLGRPAGTVRALFGRYAFDRARIGLDVTLGLGAFVVIVGGGYLMQRGLGTDPVRSTFEMLPRSNGERAVWVLVALSAGVGEEMVFRGYLLTQASYFLNSAWSGLLAQAVCFGAAHANQGGRGVAVAAAVGVMFGGMARWRESLVPSIVAHVAIDGMAGWAA